MATKPVSTDRLSSSTVLIIALLIANLGLSSYIAFRPSPRPNAEFSKDAPTFAITELEANKAAETVVPLYNEKNISALYERFDPLAKVQFTKEQLAGQIEKLSTLIGGIESYAYSHATVAGIQGGRTYYSLHYKVRLKGGPFPFGELTLTVVRNADGLGIFGLFINGNTGQRGQ